MSLYKEKFSLVSVMIPQWKWNHGFLIYFKS